MNLDGGVAVVTGAGTGVGRELAIAFARAGARVACVGRRRERLEATVERIGAEGGEAIALEGDVTDARRVDEIFDAVVARFGTIDLLFNNHGSFRSVAPVWEADPALWWQDVTVNLLGSMLCCRAALRHMRPRGRGVIINMEGGGGSNGPNVGGSGYGSSKAALLRFSEGLARELESAGSGVLVFVMDPGFVHTEMTEAIVSTETGLRWQPFVRDWIDRGVGHRPGDCARATLELLRIASPELSGRAYSVTTDFADVERRKADIARDNLFVLHLDRGSHPR